MSILSDLKEVIVGNPNDHDFDAHLKMYANGELSALSELGAGPSEGFEISTGNEDWEDFEANMKKRNLIKVYLTTAVRIEFDPPTNSTTLQSFERIRDEAKWRIQHLYEMDIIKNQNENENEDNEL